MTSPDECEHLLSQLEGRRCGTCGADMVDFANASEIRRLRERVSELEDTIRLEKAERYIDTSYGRDSQAVGIAAEIRSRRGAEWSGAVVDYSKGGACGHCNEMVVLTVVKDG